MGSKLKTDESRNPSTIASSSASFAFGDVLGSI